MVTAKHMPHTLQADTSQTGARIQRFITGIFWRALTVSSLFVRPQLSFSAGLRAKNREPFHFGTEDLPR